MLYETKYLAYLCAIEQNPYLSFSGIQSKSCHYLKICGIKVPQVYITESLQHFDRYMKSRVEIKLPLLFLQTKT